MINILFIEVSCCIILSICILYFIKKIKTNKHSIQAFKKTLYKDLLLVKFKNGKSVYTFIVDTGSNNSLISAQYYNDLVKIKEFKNTNIITGVGNDSVAEEECLVYLKDFNGNRYKCCLLSSKALEKTFNSLQSNSNIIIHGLIGTDFLQTYKFIIDFKNLILYRNV